MNTTTTSNRRTDLAASFHSLGTGFRLLLLLVIFGSTPRHHQITHSRFENATGQGVVLDSIRAFPEPTMPLLALATLALFVRLKRRPELYSRKLSRSFS